MLKIWRGFRGITTVKPRSELGLTAQENLKYLSSPPPLTTPANISNLLSTCPPAHPFRKLTCQLPISQSFLSLQKIRCLITLRSRDLITAHLELFSLRYSPSFYYAVMLVLTLELPECLAKNAKNVTGNHCKEMIHFSQWHPWPSIFGNLLGFFLKENGLPICINKMY